MSDCWTALFEVRVLSQMRLILVGKLADFRNFFCSLEINGGPPAVPPSRLGMSIFYMFSFTHMLTVMYSSVMTTV